MIARLYLWNNKVFSNFDQVFKNTVSAYAIINAEHKIMAVNPSYINMVGQPSEKLLGHYVFDVFPETLEREARITEGFSAALAGTTAQIEEMHWLG